MPSPPPGSPPVERTLQLGFVAALVVVLVASLLPPASLPPVHTGWDKADHAFTWLALGVLGMGAWPRGKVFVLAGLVAFGGAIEVLQGLTGWRQAEWADLLADVVGLAGAALCRSALRWRSSNTRGG